MKRNRSDDDIQMYFGTKFLLILIDIFLFAASFILLYTDTTLRGPIINKGKAVDGSLNGYFTLFLAVALLVFLLVVNNNKKKKKKGSPIS